MANALRGSGTRMLFAVCEPFCALQACARYRHARNCSLLLATLEIVMQRQGPSFQSVLKTVEMIQLVSQERIQERITEQGVDVPLPHIMEEMMEVERSTWQNSYLLRCCASVDVVQYAFHPARILRSRRALQLVSHVFVSCSEVRRRDMSLDTL